MKKVTLPRRLTSNSKRASLAGYHPLLLLGGERRVKRGARGRLEQAGWSAEGVRMPDGSAADARVTDGALQRGARVRRQSRCEDLILDVRCMTPGSVCRCAAGGGGVAERWFQVSQNGKVQWLRESQLQLQSTAARPRGNRSEEHIYITNGILI